MGQQLVFFAYNLAAATLAAMFGRHGRRRLTKLAIIVDDIAVTLTAGAHARDHAPALVVKASSEKGQ
jgi:hypothetical protein